MNNLNLQRDFNNLKGYDSTADAVLTEAERYISHLERQETRLHKMEECLNNVDDSKLPDKEKFLDYFKELKVNA